MVRALSIVWHTWLKESICRRNEKQARPRWQEATGKHLQEKDPQKLQTQDRKKLSEMLET